MDNKHNDGNSLQAVGLIFTKNILRFKYISFYALRILFLFLN